MNPSTFTTTPSTLTLDGVALDDDESYVEGAVLEGPGDAVLEGPAEPLSDSEPVADSHGTRGSADAGPDFPERAWVPADTDPGPPEALNRPEWAV